MRGPLKREKICSYRAYGLKFLSDVPIAGLASQDFPRSDELQMTIKFHTCGPTRSIRDADDEDLWYTGDVLDERGDPALKIWRRRDTGEYCIRYNHGLEFRVDREASSIALADGEEANLPEFAEYLLGPVLGIVLRLRGVTCLHASAVAAGGEAIAFVGPPGAGKSTTAALFVREGHAALADDIVALREREESFDAVPGYPRLNLWPEAVRIVEGKYAMDDLVDPDAEKMQWALGERGKKFCEAPLPLRAIYLLGERNGENSPRVEGMSSQEALMGLIANTYANKLPDARMRAREFEFLGRLVRRVRVRRVTPHKDPSRLQELREIILRDWAEAPVETEDEVTR